MDTYVAPWREALMQQTSLARATLTEYVRDARQFAAWLGQRARRDELPTVTG